MDQVGFKDLKISPERLAAIEALGWVTPTPIQAQAIPAGLAGTDVVGIAQTGTGKTAAFMIPALERLTAGKGLQVLVLCPTRELAQQVAEDTESLAKGTSVRVASIFGGVGYGPQIEALQSGYEVIVATPGRFIDHIQSKRVDLSNARYLVLDEADRMLDMGFRPQIEQCIRGMPKGRQTMLFSATMPHGVHDLALRITESAVWIEATPPGTTAEGIDELFYSVKPEKKPDLLLELITQPGWEQVLIFTRTKAAADVLEARLQREGITADALHSDRQMKHRTRALERFATGKVRALVATDLPSGARRGGYQPRRQLRRTARPRGLRAPHRPHRSGGGPRNGRHLRHRRGPRRAEEPGAPTREARGPDSLAGIRLLGCSPDREPGRGGTRSEVPFALGYGVPLRKGSLTRGAGCPPRPLLVAYT